MTHEEYKAAANHWNQKVMAADSIMSGNNEFYWSMKRDVIL